MKITSFIIVLLTASTAWSVSDSWREAISPRRAPSEHWQSRRQLTGARGAQRQLAIDVALPLEQTDLSKVTPLANYKAIQTQFEQLRDERFLQDPDENWLRRITWLYPDDGCYARAQLMNDRLETRGHETLTKVYVFGDLSVQTANAHGGSVSWWYHVALAATDGKDVYVLDPAIEPLRPLKIQEWVGRMGLDLSMAVAICDASTYTPYSDCHQPDSEEKLTAIDDDVYFLPLEKERLKNLGRDWKKELGELPPWLTRSIRPKTKPLYSCR